MFASGLSKAGDYRQVLPVLHRCATGGRVQEAVDDGGSPGEELLFTSPLRLLLAVDRELNAMSEDASHPSSNSAPRLVGSGAAVASYERRRRLRELREDVQRSWEAESSRTAGVPEQR